MLDDFPERLTADEAGALADLVVDSLGPEVKSLMGRYGTSPADMFLFMPVGKEFAAAREARGLTIKKISQQLRVPQYRLRAIENARVRDLRSDAVSKYAEFLNLTNWYQDWCSENETFVEKYVPARE